MGFKGSFKTKSSPTRRMDAQTADILRIASQYVPGYRTSNYHKLTLVHSTRPNKVEPTAPICQICSAGWEKHRQQFVDRDAR